MNRDIHQFAVTGPSPQQTWHTTGTDFQTNYQGVLQADDAMVINSAPYAIQFGTERIIHVAYQSSSPLHDATFMYAYQQAHAKTLISIPIERYEQVAQRSWVTASDASQPLCLFSTGRTGSTLLCKMFSALQVPSLSEPDVFTHYAVLKTQSVSFPGMNLLSQVQGNVMHSLLHAAGSGRAAIKYRSQTNAIAAELMQATPGAVGLMLLRELMPWAESVHRAFSWAPADIIASLTLALRASEACRQAGRPLTMLRYEDLTARPLELLTKIATLCGYPATAIDQAMLSKITSTDSQQDTSLGRHQLANKQIPKQFQAEFVKLWKSECTKLKRDGVDIPEHRRK